MSMASRYLKLDWDAKASPGSKAGSQSLCCSSRCSLDAVDGILCAYDLPVGDRGGEGLSRQVEANSLLPTDVRDLDPR